MSDSGGHHQRGQSELVGIVLLFALVITVSLTVVVAGGLAISDVRTDTTQQSAEMSMNELQAAASSVSSEEAASQQVSFAESSGANARNQQASGSDIEAEAGNPGSIEVDDTAGHVTITVEDASDPAAPQTVVDEDLGTVQYEQDGQKLAYQGGGVFRRNSGTEGSSIVSPPDFQYQYKNGNPTLRLPLRTVEKPAGAETDLGPDFTITKAGPSLQPSNPSGIPSKLENKDWIEISVTSEYYRAWGELFEQRTGGSVSYPSSNTVVLRLEAPTVQGPVQGPIVSSSNSLAIKNQVAVDSYYSRTGDYNSQTPGEATVYAKNDVTYQAGVKSKIYGDLQAGGEVTIKGSKEHVTGTIYHDGPLNAKASTYGSEVGHTTSMPNIKNRDTMIVNKVSSIKSDNDNADPAADVFALEGGCTGNCELDAGDYYLKELKVVRRGTLTLDTTSGDINIAVEDEMEIDKSEMEVVGDGTVNIYNKGDFTLGSNKNTQVNIAGDDAPQLWIWQHTSTETFFGAGSSFTGVVHAGPTGSIKVKPNKNGHIYGALIGEYQTQGAGRPIHFDRALRSTDPFGNSSPDDSTVSFVQIDLTGVQVSG